MSPKSISTVNATIDHQCQHISPKGRRYHMLIDNHHSLACLTRQSAIGRRSGPGKDNPQCAA